MSKQIFTQSVDKMAFTMTVLGLAGIAALIFTRKGAEQQVTNLQARYG